MSARGVPGPEQRAVAAEVSSLLGQRDRAGRLVWTTRSLAEKCEISPEMVRRAALPQGVGRAAIEGIVRFTGLTIEELVLKHGTLAGAGSATGLTPTGISGSGVMVGRDRVLVAKSVLEALVEDGFPRDAARTIVGRAVLEDGWDTDLVLYRIARNQLEALRAKEESPNSRRQISKTPKSVRRK